MVNEYLSHPTSNWFQLNETFYRKEERYEMIWKRPNLSDYILTCGKNGGFIAMRRDPTKLAISNSDDLNINTISIFTSSGNFINKIKWEKGELVTMEWIKDDKLACVYSEGIIRLFNVFGEYEQFSVGLTNKQILIDAKFWDNGMVCYTNDFDFLCINNLNEPRITTLAKPDKIELINSWNIISPSQSLSQSVEIHLSINKTILTIDNNEIIDQKISEGPFNFISVSPNGNFLGLLNNEGKLLVVSMDFQQKLTEVETNLNQIPTQISWCGNDLLLVAYEDELKVFGPFGDLETFYYDGIIHITTELDGARIFTSDYCEFIQKVPNCILNLFSIGSTHPSALLYDALDHFEKENPKADEIIRIIGNQLEEAVENCLNGANNEWDTSLQSSLLKAASFGKTFLDNYNSDKFVNQCQIHRVLNQVRMFEIGIPLTIEQLNDLTIEKLIHRLLEMHQHFLALKICQYIGLKTDEVMIHWACEKIRSSLDDEETTSKIILQKIGKYPGLAYHKIAKAANQSGQLQLAINLLDREPCAKEQVPMLLDMQEDDLALNKAILSGDANLVYFVLLQIKQKLSYGEFFKLITTQPIACNLFEKYCKNENLELLNDFYYQDDRRYDLANLKMLSSFSLKEAEAYKLIWMDLLKDFQTLKSYSDEYKLIEEQVKLHEYQNQLKSKCGQSIFGVSLAETIKLAIKFKEHNIANKLKVEFKVPDKTFWYLKIKGYILGSDWEGLEEFSKSKKSPIGYKPFFDLCVQAQQTSQALKYAIKCPAEIRPKLFMEIHAYKEAAQQAFINKDLDTLKLIREKVKDLNLRQEVDALLIKLEP